MDDGHVVVDSIEPITLEDITYDLARESGFDSVEDLLGIAKHGSGDQVFLIRFHYLRPGAWDTVPIVDTPPRAAAARRAHRSQPRPRRQP
jgi:hypothetical protein